MAYELRAMSAGEILDQSFRVLKDHFVVIVGSLAVASLPMQLASSMNAEQLQGTASPNLGALGLLLVTVLVSACAWPLAQLAATHATAAAYLGEPFSFGSVFRDAARAYFPYLGTSFLLFLAMIPLMMLLVLPGIYFAICWSLIGPVAVVEQTFGTHGLRRSRTLVRGRFWHTALVLLATFVVLWVASLGPAWVLGAIPFVGTLLSALISTVANAFGAVAVVVLYFDLRCRHEDFDLVRLASQVGAQAPQAPGSPVGVDAENA